MESCAAFTLTPAICAHGEIGHGGGRCGKAERGAWTELGHVCHATCVEVHVFGKFEIKPRWMQIVATPTKAPTPSLALNARSLAHRTFAARRCARRFGCTLSAQASTLMR